MRLPRSVLLAVAALVCVQSAAADLSRVSLEAYDGAVCTDGSTAAYYWKQATAGNENRWIVYLEGGGWCWDAGSCEHRCGSPSSPNNNTLCGSGTWGDSVALSGLMWPSDAGLAGWQGANKVFVRYCTSDGHMGAADAFGYHFRGNVVVEAVFSDLVANRGLGTHKAQLLFGGGSAGARGAMVHLDYVPAMLGPDAAANVQVVGFLDSPLWIDAPPFPGVNFPGLPATTQGVFASYNVQHVGPHCSEMYTGSDGWKCLFGQYRMPFVSTPYMLIASQADEFQLGTNVGHKPSNPAELEYAARFAAATKALVLRLEQNFKPAANGWRSAVLSWSCFDHSTSLTAQGFDQVTCTTANVTMADTLMRMLDQPNAKANLTVVDDCVGFACGAGCSK